MYGKITIYGLPVPMWCFYNSEFYGNNFIEYPLQVSRGYHQHQIFTSHAVLSSSLSQLILTFHRGVGMG